MQILEDYNLSDMSHYKIGGNARYFVEINNEEDLLALPKIIKEKACRYMVVGETTNILFDDKGYDGMIIKINNKKITFLDNELQTEEKIVKSSKTDQTDDEKVVVEVESGININYLAVEVAKKGYSGLEWAGGLPGTVGGAIRGNAGAFKGEMKDSIIDVLSFDLAKGAFVTRSNQECEFDYRSSIFKAKYRDEIIWSAKIVLTKSDTKAVTELSQQRLQYRLTNHPMEYPSLGSTFKNLPVGDFSKEIFEKNNLQEFVKDDPFPIVPIGILIDRLGLKGYRVGGAEISTKHANFLVNIGGATCDDVKAVISHVKELIKEKYGVEPQEEIMIVE